MELIDYYCIEVNAGKKMVPKPGFEPGQAYTH